MHEYKWLPEYSVGNDLLDKQHKVILGLVKEINLLDPTGEKFLTSIHHVIFHLRDYVKMHFSTEEEMCRLIGFAETEDHIAQHRQLIRQLDAIEREALRGEVDLDVFQQFINDWWQDHVLGSDQAIKPYFSKLRRAAATESHD